MRELRAACETIAERARNVRIERDQIPLYAVSLTLPARLAPAASAALPGRDPHPGGAARERLAAFWLTLDAINFGSGWFPTLRKRQGRSGYYTIATGLRERFDEHGPWSATELTQLDRNAVARTLGQDPDHELMALFAASLRDLGTHVVNGFDGSFAKVVDTAGRSAVALATTLGEWRSFADSSAYDELTVPFLKRAQIAAADLARAGAAEFTDIDQLTMFADNLVPHVLRIDGILGFDHQLVERIESGELIDHGSREEVEIRACAVHAVELIVAARPRTCAAEIDELLWHRGQDARYKASPRHRSRCTAY
jgi:Potential Queuosine, Q, salvage protein family